MDSEMQRFKGQIAVITGGARGIGRGIASRLAKEKATVVLFDLLEEELKDAVQDMKKKGLDVRYRCLDVSSEIQVQCSVDSVAKEFGKIDIMINCAGIVGPTDTKISEYTYDDFMKVITVNLNGSFLMAKAVLPYMIKENYGRILLIGSIGGKEGNPGMVGYAASKSGVMGLVKGIGKEYAKTGVTINGLAPAVIATDMNMDTAPEMLNYMADKIPMGRLGTVEEVAAVSSWIVSREASFNTGYIFDLSGGRATY